MIESAVLKDSVGCCCSSSDAEIHWKKLKVSLLFYGILAIFDGRYITSQYAKVTQNEH